MKEYLERNPQIDVTNIVDRQGYTLLHQAVY